jgi:hypothetical protein
MRVSKKVINQTRGGRDEQTTRNEQMIDDANKEKKETLEMLQ